MSTANALGGHIDKKQQQTNKQRKQHTNILSLYCDVGLIINDIKLVQLFSYYNQLPNITFILVARCEVIFQTI